MRTSDDARDLLNDFARRHGVTTSALLEAIARRLPSDDRLEGVQADVISEARAIMVERNRRD